MPMDHEEKQRIPTGYGTRKRSRLAQLKYAHEQRRKSTDITGGGDSAMAIGSGMAATKASGSMAVTESEDVDVCTGSGDTHSYSELSIASSSQSDQPDVDDHGEDRPPMTDDSCLFVQVASLKNVVKNILCPYSCCRRQDGPCHWISH